MPVYHCLFLLYNIPYITRPRTQNKHRPQSNSHLALLVFEHPTFDNMHQSESSNFSVFNHQLALVSIH